MIDFPHRFKIKAIVDRLPENTCGSASACIVFEKFNLPYDPLYFIEVGRDGNATSDYPTDGCNIFGIALAMAKTNLVYVHVYIDFDVTKEYSILEEYEKPIIDELLSLNNITINPSISLIEICECITDNCVPILAFNRNGKKENGHFSPLRGLRDEQTLSLPLGDAEGPCDCDKDVFVNTWWTAESLRSCIIVKKN